MKRGIWVALVLAGCLAAAPRLIAQASGGGDGTGAGQDKPGADSQKPAPAQAGANPFPEDTTTVPVMPTKIAPPLPQAQGSFSEGDSDTGSARVPLPGEDTDPVRSPDDPVADTASDQADAFSSSLKGMEKVLPPPDSDLGDKKKKREREPAKQATHQEAAATDINVGGYYLEKKNWKAALSRYESAMVLDPENPEVYFGLAEAQRHLGNLAEARANYLKLLDYDPDGPHGKEARKALKDPALANAQNAAPGPPAQSDSPK